MNIEEKTKMAHEYFRDVMAFIRKEGINHEFYFLIEESWEYADAMEAEYNKRIKAKAEKDAEESKVFFGKLTKNEDGSHKHFHTTLNHGECFDCGEKLMDCLLSAQQKLVSECIPFNNNPVDWQPDWSVSPERATAWKIDDHGVPMWLQSHNNINQPYVWLSDAPNFDYQGNWKDSLRKRP